MALHELDLKESIKQIDTLEYCICAIFNDEICKFKVTFDDVDITYLTDEYISMLDVYFFEVCDEASMPNKEIAKKYFPYLGKYRLEGKFKSTDNYFVPFRIDKVLETLFCLHKEGTLKEDGLKNMYLSYGEKEDDRYLKFIHLFFKKANIELFDKYTEEELNSCLNFLEKFSSDTRLSDIYSSLKVLLVNSKENTDRINKLGLNDCFMKAINSKKSENPTLTKKHN